MKNFSRCCQLIFIYVEEELPWEDYAGTLTVSGRKKLKADYYEWLVLSQGEDTTESRQLYREFLDEAATASHLQIPSRQERIRKEVADPLLPRSLDETATKVRKRNLSPQDNILTDTPSYPLTGLAQALTRVLPNSGNVIERYQADIEKQAAKVKTLTALVLNSGTNVTMPDKDRGFPPIPGTEKGFEYTNPGTGMPEYTSKTSLVKRFADLDQVPIQQSVVVGNPCAKICVSCNTEVFEKHIKKLPAPGKGMFNFGAWPRELRTKLVCVQNYKDWFCPSCPSTSEGSPILLLSLIHISEPTRPY